MLVTANTNLRAFSTWIKLVDANNPKDKSGPRRGSVLSELLETGELEPDKAGGKLDEFVRGSALIIIGTGN